MRFAKAFLIGIIIAILIVFGLMLVFPALHPGIALAVAAILLVFVMYLNYA